ENLMSQIATSSSGVESPPGKRSRTHIVQAAPRNGVSSWPPARASSPQSALLARHDRRRLTEGDLVVQPADRIPHLVAERFVVRDRQLVAGAPQFASDGDRSP